MKFVKDYVGLRLHITLNNAKKTSVELFSLPTEIRNKLALYGLQVKLNRSYAGVRSPEDQDKIVIGLVEQLKAGNWERQTNGKTAILKTLETLKETLKSVEHIPEAKEKIQQKIAELEQQL